MTFGEALEALKEGEVVARKEWYGCWKIEYVLNADTVEYENMIISHSHNGGISLAQPNQADLLARDWKIVE